MKVVLHIGPDTSAARRLQATLVGQRDWFADHGILVPRRLGKHGNWRLHVASLMPEHADALRHARGFASAQEQEVLRLQVATTLNQEAADRDWSAVLLTAPELATSVVSSGGFACLKGLLPAKTHSVSVLAQLPSPRQGWMETLKEQFVRGRTTPYEGDFAHLRNPVSWHQRYAGILEDWDWEQSGFAAVELPPPWLDSVGFLEAWRLQFGDVFALPATEDQHSTVVERIARFLGTPPLPPENQKELPTTAFPEPRTLNDAAELNRSNRLSGRGTARGQVRRLFRSATGSGDKPQICSNTEAFDVLEREWNAQFGLRPPNPIRKADIAIRNASPESGSENRAIPELGQTARTLFDETTRERLHEITSGRFAPHNSLGSDLSQGSEASFPKRSGPAKGPPRRLVVGCMKDEGPYILEWIAHHREVGFDHFLVFTNDCSDGTVDLLERLQESGLVTHVDNSIWHGKSPQQAALNRAMESELVQQAEWIAHIDVDEFINIKCGHGTLDDLFAVLPSNTTNIAMTWRMFGNSGVTQICDLPVTRQFTNCAPSYCPKPHTMWGFKTLSKQLGVYSKLSCHRPNKPDPDRLDELNWVNGSGQPMSGDVSLRGWRSSTKTAGYDLVQLNHYALRSQDSFLIKRKRGRALHVDRDIGRNYWIRMDWNDHKETTILRHAARTDAAIQALLADTQTRSIHDACVDWHQKRASRLRDDPAFAALVAEAADLKFSAAERVAYTLSLDHDS